MKNDDSLIRSGQSALILGGARSGKTTRALSLSQPFANKFYIATAQVFDEEMATRVRCHQAERDGTWETIEAPYDLVGALQSIAKTVQPDKGPTIAVIDCMTLWLTNLMLNNHDIERETACWLQAMQSTSVSVVMVSNEIGNGVVPASKTGRQFRDLQGRLNQDLAQAADIVELVVAGLPMRLKPRERT